MPDRKKPFICGIILGRCGLPGSPGVTEIDIESDIRQGRMRAKEKRWSSSAGRARVDAMPPRSRSRLANGHLGFDMRTKQGRRWRDLFIDAMRQTGGRNESLCKQLATLTMQRELMDATVARGEVVDAMDLVRVAGAISRLTRMLGIVDEHEPIDATQEVIKAINRGLKRHAEARA